MSSRLVFLLVAALALLGCGARTELSSGDAAPSPDAGPGCAPRAERCDGTDEDCDGRVDEGVAPMRCDEVCGDPVECVDGRFGVCAPRPPEPEACNGRDDDCDGAVDEGLGFGPLEERGTLRTDEGMTVDCTSCYWAFDPQLAPLSGGDFLALWYVGLSGGDERPNLFGRRVARDGTPLDEVALRSESFALDLWTVGDVAGREVIGTCFRVGSQDRLGWQIVRPDGTIEEVHDAEGPCRDSLMNAGERVATAWVELDDLIRVWTARPDGSDPRMDVFDMGREVNSVYPAAHAGRVGMLILVIEGDVRELFFASYSDRAERLGEPVPLPLEWASYPHLVGVDDGWLLILPGNRRLGRSALRVSLALDGTIRRGPEPFEDGRLFASSRLGSSLLRHPSEPVIAAVWQEPPPPGESSDMRVELLDERGIPTRTWSGPAPGSGWILGASTRFDEDRLLVAWADTDEDRTPNRVYLQRFGCTP